MSVPASAPSPAPAPQAVQNPLTLVMSIKSPEEYEKLHATLMHIQSLPPDKNPVWVALNHLKSVHFARFVFLENNKKLAVITTYDGTFEHYINEFVDNIGDVFNQILSHMEDAPPLPVQKHRDEFLKYVQSNDLRAIEPFYSAYPQSSVVDVLAATGQI